MRRFASTEHLAPEAVAAFVDGELGMSAHARAINHLTMCPECAGAIDAQMAARTRLRTAGEVSIPSDLLGALSEIPTREIDVRDHGVAPDAPTARQRAPRGRRARPAPPMAAPEFGAHQSSVPPQDSRARSAWRRGR